MSWCFQPSQPCRVIAGLRLWKQNKKPACTKSVPVSQFWSGTWYLSRHMCQRSHGLCQSSMEYGNIKHNPTHTKSVPGFGILKWNMIWVKVTHACVKNPMVHVRVRWGMETQKITQHTLKVFQSSKFWSGTWHRSRRSCTDTCVKNPMVHVRVWWSMETPKITQHTLKVSQSSEF